MQNDEIIDTVNELVRSLGCLAAWHYRNRALGGSEALAYSDIQDLINRGTRLCARLKGEQQN
jgi:hypothetical protein